MYLVRNSYSLVKVTLHTVCYKSGVLNYMYGTDVTGANGKDKYFMFINSICVEWFAAIRRVKVPL